MLLKIGKIHLNFSRKKQKQKRSENESYRTLLFNLLLNIFPSLSNLAFPFYLPLSYTDMCLCSDGEFQLIYNL